MYFLVCLCHICSPGSAVSVATINVDSNCQFNNVKCIFKVIFNQIFLFCRMYWHLHQLCCISLSPEQAANSSITLPFSVKLQGTGSARDFNENAAGLSKSILVSPVWSGLLSPTASHPQVQFWRELFQNRGMLSWIHCWQLLAKCLRVKLLIDCLFSSSASYGMVFASSNYNQCNYKTTPADPCALLIKLSGRKLAPCV